MAQFNIKTVAVANNGQPIWQKGDRSIWEITGEVNGRQGKLRTYSRAIATVGFNGEIITREQQGRDGNTETFVKRVPNEDFTQQGSYPQSTNNVTTQNAPTSADRGGYQPKDEAAIKAMWAIGQAVALFNNSYPQGGGQVPAPDEVEYRAVDFFHMVDRVKTAPELEDLTQSVEPSKEELTNVFGDVQTFDDGSAQDLWANQ